MRDPVIFESVPPPASLIDQASSAVSDPQMLRTIVAGLTDFSLRLLAALAILIITLWLSKRLARLAGAALQKANRRHPTDTTLSNFVSTLVRYAVIAIGLVAVLQQLGVQATSVIAVLGAASLAVGLALQGTLGNVAAGVMILMLRPYRIGDIVELNGRQGTVAGLDLFNTEVVDFDGLTVYLPNGKVFGDMIVNVSQSGRRRIVLTFTVDYEDDLDLAISTLLEVAAADPRVLAEPAPWAKVSATADSGIDLLLRCWTVTGDWAETHHDMIKAVKETFDKVGLSFPYPHQVNVERVDIRPPPPKIKAPAKRGKAAGPRP